MPMIINKLIPFILMVVLSANSLFSQESPEKASVYGWKNEITGGLNLTQTSFDNWAQGGESSFAWQLNLNAKFVNDEEKYNWSNTGKISYGQTKVGDLDSRKSVDEIKLESVLTFKVKLYVSPYVATTGETQFTKGYRFTETDKTAISDFLDPAYFTQSAGLGFSKDEHFKTRLGASLKETITSNFPIPYADDPETAEVEKTKVELGAESVTDVSYTLAENILFTSKLELFSNLEAFNEIDVQWDSILAAKVAKYIDVNFNVKLFYDRDISKQRQLKQALAVGLTYTFL